MWKVVVLINTICAIGEVIIYILLKREDAKENRRDKSDSRKHLSRGDEEEVRKRGHSGKFKSCN